MNLLDNMPYQPSKIRTKKWIERNDDAPGFLIFKTTMLNSSLCDYSDAYILYKVTKTVANAAVADAGARNENKKETFKNRAPFTDSTNEINSTQEDNVKYLRVLMLMYNLIEYSENHSKNVEINGNIAEMSQL